MWWNVNSISPLAFPFYFLSSTGKQGDEEVSLSTEPIESATRPLERIHDVQSGDGFSVDVEHNQQMQMVGERRVRTA